MKHLTTILLSALCAANLYSQTLLGDAPETPDQRQARMIVESVESSKRAILGELRHGINLLWEYEDPQAVLDILGPRAARLYAINTRLTEYIATELTLAGDTESLAELARLVAKVRPSTIHPDGTVTLLPLPEPTPKPTTGD